MDKKFLIISVILHSLIFINLTFNIGSKGMDVSGEPLSSTEIELVEATNGNDEQLIPTSAEEETSKNGENKGDSNEKESQEIIDLNSEGNTEGDSLEGKDFYWGIGITTMYTYMTIKGKVFYGIYIQKAHEGYSAWYADLRKGDFIFMVDSEIITQKEVIKGDKPKKLLLTIYRSSDNIVINKEVERVKVYY